MRKLLFLLPAALLLGLFTGCEKDSGGDIGKNNKVEIVNGSVEWTNTNPYYTIKTVYVFAGGAFERIEQTYTYPSESAANAAYQVLQDELKEEDMKEMVSDTSIEGNVITVISDTEAVHKLYDGMSAQEVYNNLIKNLSSGMI